MSNVYMILLIFAYFFAKSFGIPVENGQDVGSVEIMGKTPIVTGQQKFPFIAHLTIETLKYGKKNTAWCTGVIIGKKAVLTAAHCLDGKVKPTVTVYVGIVDIKLEKGTGQKVTATKHSPHKQFRPQCPVGQRCCYATNDLTILWLENELNFGAYVQAAKLNRDEAYPLDKEGWILGWGLTYIDSARPHMLQKGLVKVVSTQTCERHNKRLYITQNVVCLTGVKQGTQSGSGDSGGPFVIGDVVYGISSFAAHESCRTLDIYTHIAKYKGWIDRTLKEGPPIEKGTTGSVKPNKSKKKKH